MVRTFCQIFYFKKITLKKTEKKKSTANKPCDDFTIEFISESFFHSTSLCTAFLKCQRCFFFYLCDIPNIISNRIFFFTTTAKRKTIQWHYRGFFFLLQFYAVCLFATVIITRCASAVCRRFVRNPRNIRWRESVRWLNFNWNCQFWQRGVGIVIPARLCKLFYLSRRVTQSKIAIFSTHFHLA